MRGRTPRPWRKPTPKAALPMRGGTEDYAYGRMGVGLLGLLVGVPFFGGALVSVLSGFARGVAGVESREQEPATIKEAVALAQAPPFSGGRAEPAQRPDDAEWEPEREPVPDAAPDGGNGGDGSEATDGEKKPRKSTSGYDKGPGGLKEYATDMTEKARAGGYEPMIGRQDELRRTIRVLAQRKSNCPVLIGEAGVGKTSIVQGLAQKIADGQVPDVLRNKRIYELDLTALKGGASYIGQLEGRLKSVLDEVKDEPDVLLFVDEIHRLIGAGSHGGEKDVGGNAIKRPLTDGELQIVGATTNSEYREIERDAALARRFEPVSVPALTVEETLDVLYRVRDAEEKHHSIEVSEEALEAAARLSDRYIKDRNLPASAVDVLSNACSEAALSGDQEVLAQHVAAAISESTGVPVGDIGADEGQKMMHLAEAVKSRVIGQDAAAEMLAEAVRRKRAGFGAGRPVSALFAGSTGTGKTETAKALAEALFGGEDAMTRLDMSEYQEPHSISRLIGSPPGYHGSDEGGRLTEAVRRRLYSVVLFDEIEKAHEDVLTPLLQVLDDGRLTDAKGTMVDFSNAVVILTSNLAAAEIGQIYLAGEEVDERRVKDLLVGRYGMKPELANRMGAIVPFRPLEKGHTEEIARLMVAGVAKSLKREHEVDLDVSDAALAWLAEAGYEPESGARPLRNLIERKLENPLADLVIAKRVGPGDAVRVEVAKYGSDLVLVG